MLRRHKTKARIVPFTIPLLKERLGVSGIAEDGWRAVGSGALLPRSIERGGAQGTCQRWDTEAMR